MREKVIEQKLVAEVKKRGGICPKWVSPGFDGSRHRLLMRLGFRVYVLDDPEQIGGILDEIQST